MIKMNIKYVLLALFTAMVMVAFLSCNTCKSFGETALGNKFALVEADEKNKSILYCTSPKCCYVGHIVIPTNVVSYKRNSKWIIAKSEDKGEFKYWIIDKGFTIEFKKDSGMEKEIMSHVIGPLDSTTFNKELESRQIRLSLE
ncbi:MAG: hypothetical protein SFU87_09125 [Chitinophagaceae bacterium]|nr:hypothetical protein [Chitinophagaceae bacterium]